MRSSRRSGGRQGNAFSRFVTLTFFIAVLVIIVGIYFFLQGAKAHKVAIISVSSLETEQQELNRAVLLLNHVYGFKAEKIKPEAITSHPSVLDGYDAVWIPKTDTLPLPDTWVKEGLPQRLKTYLERGGNILLTGEAFPLITSMGLEPEKPGLHHISVTGNGFIHTEGFHSFRGHPLFRGLYGGVFLYQPLRDTILRAWGYFDNKCPKNGKVVAVRWHDIFLDEKDKVVLEYREGKGRLIAVGSTVFLTQPNDLADHMKKFISNIFEYFINPPEAGQTVSYWDYTPEGVKPDTLYQSHYNPGEAEAWTLPEPLLHMTDYRAGGAPWDLAGARMVIMGHEKGGMEEVWIHPFMALRDYRTGILFEGDTTVRWLQDERPEADIRATAFIRHYHFVQGQLDEVIVPDPYLAAGVLHYAYNGKVPARLVIRFRSNLRWMWPYAQSATGGLRYAWSDSLQAFTIRDTHGEAMMVLGMNKKPQATAIGHYNNIKITGEGFSPVTGDSFMVTAAARIRLRASDRVDVVLAGSWGNPPRAVSLYRRAMKKPQQIIDRQYDFTTRFFNQATRIKSPDKRWNEAYRWALLNTRRFMVQTPGVGTSLVAGYATTDRGWDGAQPVSGRPGYAWYFGRDGEWSAMAMLDYGDFEQVKKILELYIRYQDISGKIYHELTTSGLVHYSAADATPLFVVLAGRYLRYTGDITFIGEHREAIRKAMNYCYSTDFDHDGLIENMRAGHGWIEGGPLYGSRTTLYLASVWAEALKEAAGIFYALGEDDVATGYDRDRKKVTGIINTNFWNDSTRFFNHGLYPDGTFNPHKTVMPAIPILFGQIDSPEKTQSVLKQFAGSAFCSDWGMRIMPEGSKDFNPGSYHGGSVWPLYTGWTSLAEYKGDHPVQGFMNMSENMRIGNFWAKGAIEEVMHGTIYKPFGVCWHQCWSEIMAYMPAIEGMLGWSPDALNHTVTLKPVFPAGWDTVTIIGLRTGADLMDMKMEKNDSVTVYTFSNKGPEQLMIRLYCMLPSGSSISNVKITGKEGKHTISSEKFAVNVTFLLKKEAVVTIHHQGGVALTPPVPAPWPGNESHGFRILGESFSADEWSLGFQGQSESTDTFRIRAWTPVGEVTGASLIREKGKDQVYQIHFAPGKTKYVKKQVTFRLGIKQPKQ